MKFFITLFALCSLIYRTTLTPDNEFILPEGIKTCSQDDPKIDDCFKETFQEQMKLFKTGSKELNIPQLDPWLIPNHRVEYSNGGIQINLVVSNAKVLGMGKTIIKSVRSKINNKGLHMVIDMFLPEIFMEGNFKANFKYNELKMRPKGYYNLTMSEITNTATVFGTYEQVNGKRHLKMKNFNIDPQIQKVKVNINGLFSESALDNVFVNFINQYWAQIYKFILVETKPTWEPILVESANQFLAHVPIDVLITPQTK